MSIKPLSNHYAMENLPSVYDEEAMTALELAGRTNAKVNETVDAFNKLESETNTHLQEQDASINTMNNVTMPAKVVAEFKKNLDNGTFEDMVNDYAGNLEARLDNLLTNVPQGSTSMDADVIDARVDNGGYTYPSAGNALRKNLDGICHLFGLLGFDEIPFTSGEVLADGSYIKNDGTLGSHENYQVVKIDLPNNYSKFFILNNMSIPNSGVIDYNDTSLSLNGLYGLGYPVNVINGHGNTTLKINTTKDGSLTGVYKIYGVRDGSPIVKNSVTVLENLYQTNAYDNNGSILPMKGLNVYKVFVREGYNYVYHSSGAVPVPGGAYNENGAYLGALKVGSNGLMVVPSGTSYMMVNQGTSDTFDYVSEEEGKSVTISGGDGEVFSHIVNRPYTFANKTAIFFGDSITKGFTKAGNITENGYPKLFANHVGMNFTNAGVGGSLITPGKNESADILTTIKSHTLNQDYLFIAGGTNDYSLGATLTEFESALRNVCDYLVDNFSGEVFIMAPIGRAEPGVDVKAPLNEYRRILCKVALEYEFNFINGGLFNFPEEANTLASLVYGDGLHPSEQGYRQYAKALATVLC